MNTEELTNRLLGLEAKVFAQGVAIGELLEAAPQTREVLLVLSEHLKDAPPIAMTDESLAHAAAHIRLLCRAPKA